MGADKTTLVKFLLARGADPNRNLRGESRTALECAAYSASIPTLILLLDAGAQIKTRSALVMAAREGRTDVVAYLLDRGADVDEVPDNDDIYDNERQLGLGNALCTAARAGKAEVVKLLLERSANRQAKDTLGRSALDLAELNYHSDCKDVLSQGE